MVAAAGWLSAVVGQVCLSWASMLANRWVDKSPPLSSHSCDALLARACTAGSESGTAPAALPHAHHFIVGSTSVHGIELFEMVRLMVLRG